MPRSGRTLIIANNFPPVLGGSASVYANLARCRPRDILVLAPSRNYVTGEPLDGWREYDSAAPYRITRLPLLRTVIRSAPATGLSKLVLTAGDLLIRTRVVSRIIFAALFQDVRSVCVGELLASAWLFGVLRLAPGIRVAVYIHGEEITTEDSYDPQHERARRALGMAQSIVVVSRFTLDAVQKLLGPGHPARITLIENGVNTELFTVGPKSQALVQRYGLEGKFVFVSVCRLLRKKGIDTAIRALPSVIAQFPAIRYVIVGQGEFAEDLRQLVEELRLGEYVVFTGRVADDELVDHYRLGDVFVMPNRRLANGDTEGFGLVFLEANSCGIPVVAGRDGGSLDAVTDDVNGLVVDGSSVEQVAHAMLRLRSDEALRKRIAAGALARAANSGWDEKANLLIHLDEPGEAAEAAREDMQSWTQILAVGAASLFVLVLATPYILLIRVADRLARRHPLEGQ